MTIVQKLETFVKQVFKTTLETFLEALKLSPNAQGYVSGSVTELLLKKHLESLGFEVKRIKEKWEGKKHLNHHGDFYLKDEKGDWYVIESKGAKSNSEKWHRLYNYSQLKTFLFKHREKIFWLSDSLVDEELAERQIDEWIRKHLPKFTDEYKFDLYSYEEIQEYVSPKTETRKSVAMARLKDYERDELSGMVNERLEYLKDKIKVIETHFVAGTSKMNERSQATPRKDEFNLVSVDIFLKYDEHKFLFANPRNLDSSSSDSGHLQQNYVIGFVFNNSDLNISDEWSDDFGSAFSTVKPSHAINEMDMQIDDRSIICEEDE